MMTPGNPFGSLGFFRRPRGWLVTIAISVTCILLFISLFAGIIATNQPLYIRIDGHAYYPAFRHYFNRAANDSIPASSSVRYTKILFDTTDWRRIPHESILWPLIPYSAGVPDPFNRQFASPGGKQIYADPTGHTSSLPFRLRHYLGTDRLGNDIAAGFVHGASISLRVGFFAVGISALIGILLGSIAGFFMDDKWTAYLGRYYLLFPAVILAFFYAFLVRDFDLKSAASEGLTALARELSVSGLIFFVVIVVFWFIGGLSKYIRFLDKPVTIPIDSWISRLIEVLDSLPWLLLIITIAAVIREKSIALVIVIIGLSSWTSIARFTRAEFLKNRPQDYVTAAQALGYSPFRIIFIHILRNAIAPAMVVITFGIAGAIIAESSLSFLGIGVPDEVVTWGSMLSSGRQELDAWWVTVFPAAAIFLTVLSLNIIGEWLRDSLDPRLRS